MWRLSIADLRSRLSKRVWIGLAESNVVAGHGTGTTAVSSRSLPTAPVRAGILADQLADLKAGLFISMPIGIVLAYVNRGKAGGFVESHYTFLIRTFWIGLLYALISVVLMMLVVGFLLMFVVAVWFIARCVLGLQALQRGEPVKNPQSWLLGS